MKLGFWLAGAAAAFGSHKVKRQAEPAATVRPTMEYTSTDNYHTSKYPEYSTRPEKPHSPTGKPHTDSSYSGTGSPHMGSPHTGSPHTGSAMPNMDGNMGGCNGAAMKKWAAAMARWREQQQDWEMHFEAWKYQQGMEMGDGSGMGDWDMGSGGWEDKPDNDWGMDWGMDWSMVQPLFDFMNSPEFCDTFYMLPAEWDPTHWVGLCKANVDMQKEMEHIVMYMIQGMMSKDEFTQQTCDTVGKYLITLFEVSYWPEGRGLVYAMEPSCHCSHNIVYDLIMGNPMDWMKAYSCGQTMMGVMDWFNEPMIPKNWTLPEGAEHLLALWLDSEDEVREFMRDPYSGLMHAASEWKAPVSDLIEGFEHYEMVLAIADSKLAAYGIEGSIHDMNSSDLFMAMDMDYERAHMFWDNNVEKYMEEMGHMDMNSPMFDFVREFGFDVETMMALAMDGYGMTEHKGEMMLNLALYFHMYADVMNGLVADSDREFIPWDAFGMIAEYSDSFQMEYQLHLAMDDVEDHGIVDHVFATWQTWMYQMMDDKKPTNDSYDHMMDGSYDKPM